MNNKQIESSWLYQDKALTKKLTTTNLMKWDGDDKKHYFYDGNNGDRHRFISYRHIGDLYIVTCLNVSQHLDVDKLAEHLEDRRRKMGQIPEGSLGSILYNLGIYEF